ncbi:uncharacterized protein KQ657_002659 [Scheffersomyces spartinae]|uniref:Uncharacterized protein n=1 Tax=Scheffersomyces spartinae TaxID=45513 RepID=A0A9P7V603_9ASCO|nr:uncharacterized protein KQ657_002659 [Scheffersomyces spartinae]KAG7191870.1 hypothetical protein KQ657_002659 [Scheffersomyces spartinae]
MALPFRTSLWWDLIYTVIKGPIIFIALFVVKINRDHHSTVLYTEHKTLALQIYHTCLSKRFGYVSMAYVASSILIGSVYLTQLKDLRGQFYMIPMFYEQKPAVNDSYVYYWFVCICTGIGYALHHLVYQRNKLTFQFGVYKVSVDKLISKHLGLVFSQSLALTVVSTGITLPIIYMISRSTLYKMNWVTLFVLGLDYQSVPPLGVTWSLYFQTIFLTFNILLLWEIVNHLYNVYASIGCLDGKKLISTYSKDPISTLLSGLRNTNGGFINQLSRVTAFQELAYISTSSDDKEAIKLRKSIYKAKTTDGYLCLQFLIECATIIRDTTTRINFRTDTDLRALKKITQEQDNSTTNVNNNDTLFTDIFGNSSIHSSSSPPSSSTPITNDLRIYPQTTNSHVINLQSENLVIFAKKIQDVFNHYVSVPLLNLVISHLPKAYRAKMNSFKTRLMSRYNQFNDDFLSSWFGVFFRITLKRDCESRVLDPVTFGNSIISISHLCTHSISEDLLGVVTDIQVSDVFKLLEKPIRVCSNYTDYIPHSVYLPRGTMTRRDPKQLIAVLHDLAIMEFYQMCIKFNFKLDDLILNLRTYKLAKHVIDVAIAEQTTQDNKILTEL